MTSSVGDTWYRYEDYAVSNGSFNADGDYESFGPSTIKVRLREYRVVKVTPKGVRLGGVLSNGGWYSSDTRLVLHDSRKKYAAPTLEEAKMHFIARKSRQLGIYRARVRHVEQALAVIEGTECLT